MSATTMESATGARLLANHIGGEWVASSAVETLQDRDPATGEPLARVPLSNADDVGRAVRTARAAQVTWRATSPLVRARAVMALRAILDEHRDELAELVARDMGKTLDDARGEVVRGPGGAAGERAHLARWPVARLRARVPAVR